VQGGSPVTRHVFILGVKDTEKLQQLNEQYGAALARAAGGIAGLEAIEKYLLGGTYAELIDFDGDFADFARQFAADPEVRQFLREVDACFVQSLRELAGREMSLLQSLSGPTTPKESG
jgi:hypothetical protein